MTWCVRRNVLVMWWTVAVEWCHCMVSRWWLACCVVITWCWLMLRFTARVERWRDVVVRCTVQLGVGRRPLSGLTVTRCLLIHYATTRQQKIEILRKQDAQLMLRELHDFNISIHVQEDLQSDDCQTTKIVHQTKTRSAIIRLYIYLFACSRFFLHLVPDLSWCLHHWVQEARLSLTTRMITAQSLQTVRLLCNPTAISCCIKW